MVAFAVLGEADNWDCLYRQSSIMIRLYRTRFLPQVSSDDRELIEETELNSNDFAVLADIHKAKIVNQKLLIMSYFVRVLIGEDTIILRWFLGRARNLLASFTQDEIMGTYDPLLTAKFSRRFNVFSEEATSKLEAGQHLAIEDL